ETAGHAEQRLETIDLIAAFRHLPRRRQIAEDVAEIAGVEADGLGAAGTGVVEDALPFHRRLRRQREYFQLVAEPQDLHGQLLVGSDAREERAERNGRRSRSQALRPQRLRWPLGDDRAEPGSEALAPRNRVGGGDG